jgi:tetratricopeptide (TPR) repeat protein
MKKWLLLWGIGLTLSLSPLPFRHFPFHSWGLAHAQEQQQKIALVIGNKDYLKSPLTNPLNDARDMAARLKKLGFKVILEENLVDQKAMKKALLAASKQIQPGGVFLFYYSGHGVQVKGNNYLIPTQVEIRSEEDIEFEALDFNRVLAEIESQRARVNIVILDACRDNPFSVNSKSLGRGLSVVSKAPPGTFIAFATAPGKTASDNATGRNGLYTSALLQSLEQPGLKLEDVFKQTARRVLRQNQDQQPWINSSLIDDFYFLPPSEGAVLTKPDLEKRYSLLILPFQANTSQVSLSYLKNGYPALLNAQLSKIPQLDLMDPEWVRDTLTQQGLNPASIQEPTQAMRLGKLLNVRYILTGSFQGNAQNITVTPRLIDLESEQTLYTQTFQQSSNQPFNFQSQVAEKMAEKMSLLLTAETQRAIQKPVINNPQALQTYVAGEQALLAGHYRQAWQSLSSAVEISPEYLAAHQQLQLATEKLGNTAETIALYQRLLKKPQSPILLWNYLGNYYQMQKDWKQAETAYRKVLQHDSHFLQAYNNLGVLALQSGQSEKVAQNWFQQAVKLNPLDPWAAFNLGKMYYDRKQYEPGLVQFEKAMELSHGKLLKEIQISLYGGTIRLYGQGRNLPGGEKIGEVVFEKQKAKPVVLFQIFDSLGGYSPEERAKIVAERMKIHLLQLTPQHVRQGEMNREVVVQTHNQLIITVGARAAIREMTDRKNLAEKWSKRLLYFLAYESSGYRLKSAAPEDSSEVQYLHEGDELYHQRKYLQALETYKKAVDINWKFYPAHLARAQVYEELGEYAQAEKNFQFVLASDPSYSEALSGLAALYLKTAVYDEAKNYARRALKVDPGSMKARKVLIELNETP